MIDWRKLARELDGRYQQGRRPVKKGGSDRNRRVPTLTRDDDPRAHPRAIVDVDHVLVRHADAARRNGLPNRTRLIGAMNSIERARKIHGARAERIVRSAFHMTGKVGT